MPTPRNNAFRIIWIVGAQLVAFGVYELIAIIRQNGERIAWMKPMPKQGGKPFRATEMRK